MEAATVLDVPLAAGDRCDRCGARALVRVFLRSGGSLLFCSHHFVANEAALIAPVVDYIQDDRSK
jgi:hypothetical protein